VSLTKLIPFPVRPGERGVVIIWTAFFMLFMLGFVAIGIDVAKLMATRTQLQNAADAAALAGASAIDFQNGTIVQDTAVVRAQQTAARNKAFVGAPVSVTLPAGDIGFPAPNEVKVVVRRSAAVDGPVVTHVAQVLGIRSLEVSATATARIEPTSSPCEGLVPMAPIYQEAGWFDPECGKTYNLKVDSGSGTQGNYQLLDFPPCDEGPCQDAGGGGAAIRCFTHYGYGCCLDLGSEYVLTEPGNKVGPFRQGMQARWDSDSDQNEDICYNKYQGNGNRVVRVPVVETFDVSGKKYVKIMAFTAFFLTQRPTGNGDMVGQFIFDVAPGEPGGGGGTLYTIRLVK